MKKKGKPAPQMRAALLRWFGREGRKLPWRGTRDPYKVWVSEIMLQQTTVAAVIPYYERFIKRWDCVENLAKASQAEVLGFWAGLGYYARARNLHRCAQDVAQKGKFPPNEQELKKLPGIGTYTAAAIAAISFGRHAVVIDTNVKRVLARVFAITSLQKTDFYTYAAALTPKKGAAKYAQALMDLGALVCRPKNPFCERCPWETFCEARYSPQKFPRRLPKKPKLLRRGLVFWIQRPDNTVLVQRRPPAGLLGGMLGFPTSAWAKNFKTLESCAPCKLRWRRLGTVRHTFTHFHLELEVYGARVRSKKLQHQLQHQLQGQWIKDFCALPSLMRKVAHCAEAQ